MLRRKYEVDCGPSLHVASIGFALSRSLRQLVHPFRYRGSWIRDRTRRLGTERMSEVTLRQRVCGQCYSVFWICPHCDRGQRYCNLTCRMQARRAQRRRANRRYQQSREGREDHRDRQREYRRRRRLLSGVTDKGSVSPTSPGRMPSCEARTAQTVSRVGFTGTFTQLPPLLICAWCGRRGLFVDRFP